MRAEKSERLSQYIWLTTAMLALAESTVVAGSAHRREDPADQSSALLAAVIDEGIHFKVPSQRKRPTQSSWARALLLSQ